MHLKKSCGFHIHSLFRDNSPSHGAPVVETDPNLKVGVTLLPPLSIYGVRNTVEETNADEIGVPPQDALRLAQADLRGAVQHDDPTADPTADPTIDPTADPTINPTSDQTQDTTADPTSDPTAAPSNAPSPARTTRRTARSKWTSWQRY